ncbi:MAG TPA: hypothetical protein VHO25_20715, partial [Polyangiaceae bacterium]|nr:hypothetical protein [Polyangiaceae bacterium]
MKAWKHWTSLGVLACGGTLAFSACGEDPCAVALSCIERPPTNDDPDSGNGGTSSDGDSGSNVGSSGTGNGNNGSGGSTGMADGSIDMDGGFNGPQLDGGNDAGQVEPPPPVCGVNPVVGCVASTQDAVFVSAGVNESGDGSQQA